MAGSIVSIPPVAAILKITGDWQKFKGLPGTEGTLKVKEPKRDKTEIFNEALKDSANEPKSGATTSRKKAAKAEPAAEEQNRRRGKEKDQLRRDGARFSRL